jgi:hypothetical protein
MQAPNAELVAKCMAGIEAGTSIEEIASAAINAQPEHAIFYFLRGTDYAAQADMQSARQDFATVLALEPEHTLARLQFIFCCLTPQLLPMVLVLLQPLLRSPIRLEQLYGQSLWYWLNDQQAEFQQVIVELQGDPSVIPAVIDNLLRLQRSPLQNISGPLIAKTDDGTEVSAVLLEIYQQKH